MGMRAWTCVSEVTIPIQSSGVQDFPRVRPVEGASKGAVPMASEVVDRVIERAKAVEGLVAKRLAREDAEPDLDLIEPATVLRSEHEANPGMHCEPFLGVLSCSRADVIRSRSGSASS